MSDHPSLMDYYAKRAGEYERLYQKPERQADLTRLRQLCAQSLAAHDVLEIACGTGYWTLAASQTAKSILATDVNDETLQIARMKKYGCEVCFRKANAFRLESLAKHHFTAGMAMHWWSHLRRSEINEFLIGFHRLFRSGSLMVFMDNRFVAGSSTPVCRTDDDGNTFQLRRLEDGTGHEILKNFPSAAEVQDSLAGSAVEISWTELPYYWLLTYRLK